uniref:Uncharacterized protein n=1 Tax=Anopheles atroparvus TaxID=41427 RepID=A0A182IVC9_ANOAO
MGMRASNHLIISARRLSSASGMWPPFIDGGEASARPTIVTQRTLKKVGIRIVRKSELLLVARREPNAIEEQPAEQGLSRELRFQLGQHQLAVVQLVLDGGGRWRRIREVDDGVQHQNTFVELADVRWRATDNACRSRLEGDEGYHQQGERGSHTGHSGHRAWRREWPATRTSLYRFGDEWYG